MMPAADQNYSNAPILILAPMGSDASNATAVLRKANLRTEICTSMKNLCERASESTGALLVSEETLDTEALDCLLKFLSAQPPWSDIPLVLLTMAGEITQKVYNIINFLDERANITLLEKPLRAITLVSVMRAALRSRNHQYKVQNLVERNSLAMEGAQMGSWDLDLRTQVVQRSLRHDQILGHDTLQPDWNMESFFKHVLAEDRAAVRARFQQVSVGDALFFECRIRRPDRSIRWIAMQGRVYGDETGRAARMTGVVTDITQRKQMETAAREQSEHLARTAEELELRVKERTAKLEETVSEMEAFSYSVSHDLRAPLRAMQGYSSLLMSEYADKIDEQGRDFLRRINVASERLDRLTQDLLTYSRVVRNPVVMEPIQLERFLPEIICQYPDFQPPRAEIVIQAPLHDAVGHEPSLVQCVSNLIGNAVKFVPPGKKPRIKIWTELAAEASAVRIWFEDNGIGIEPDQTSRIFGIFERVNKNYEGTGIGLAIVRKAAERMNGAVGVESVLGRGSKFWLQLPIKT